MAPSPIAKRKGRTMKVELTRAGLTLQLEHHGRQVFITAGDALPTTRGFFDTPAAAAAFACRPTGKRPLFRH